MSTLHFNDSEFGCKCCGDKVINPHLLAVLELVRINFNKPVNINSAYRCPTHNKNVGGADKSQHLLGTAADITVQGASPVEIYDFLTSVFPNSYGIGLYNTFVHIDVRENKARW